MAWGEGNRRGTFIVPVRRGVLVTPARRGTLVVPAESGWIVQGCAADLTSRSLQSADPTSGSLRKVLSKNDLRLDDGHKGCDSPRNKMLSCKKRFRVGHGLSRVPCILNSGRGKAVQRFQRDARTGLPEQRKWANRKGQDFSGRRGERGGSYQRGAHEGLRGFAVGSRWGEAGRSFSLEGAGSEGLRRCFLLTAADVGSGPGGTKGTDRRGAGDGSPPSPRFYPALSCLIVCVVLAIRFFTK